MCQGFSTWLGTDTYKSCLFFIFHLIFRWSTRVLTSTATGIFQLTHFPKPPRNTLLATQSGLHGHFSSILCVGDFSTVSLPSLCPRRQHFHPFVLPQLPVPEFQPPGSSGASWGVRWLWGRSSVAWRQKRKKWYPLWEMQLISSLGFGFFTPLLSPWPSSHGVAIAQGPGEVVVLRSQAASLPSEKLTGTQILWGWGAEEAVCALRDSAGYSSVC